MVYKRDGKISHICFTSELHIFYRQLETNEILYERKWLLSFISYLLYIMEGVD